MTKRHELYLSDGDVFHMVCSPSETVISISVKGFSVVSCTTMCTAGEIDINMLATLATCLLIARVAAVNLAKH